MILFKNITKIYFSNSGPVVALKNISFQVKEGEFVSIIGKSGAGKTTLFKLLIGEEGPTEGEVFFKKKSIQKMHSEELQELRQKIGVVYQDYKLLYTKTVRENVEYLMQVIGASDEIIKRDVPQILEIVGLSHRQDSFPIELSGGEKQRLVIARALSHQPELLIADEPTGNLDFYNSFEIINLLKKIHQLGTTIILASHNKGIVDDLGYRVITLDEGKLIYDIPEGKFIL